MAFRTGEVTPTLEAGNATLVTDGAYIGMTACGNQAWAGAPLQKTAVFHNGLDERNGPAGPAAEPLG
jgi:uncharacterized protein YodC (DUF2158 family)